jgi:hypothetical protein
MSSDRMLNVSLIATRILLVFLVLFWCCFWVEVVVHYLQGGFGAVDRLIRHIAFEGLPFEKRTARQIFLRSYGSLGLVAAITAGLLILRWYASQKLRLRGHTS